MKKWKELWNFLAINSLAMLILSIKYVLLMYIGCVVRWCIENIIGSSSFNMTPTVEVIRWIILLTYSVFVVLILCKIKRFHLEDKILMELMRSDSKR